MRVELESVELNNPLFLAGVNLATKLNQSKRQGLTLEYDKEQRFVLITFNTRLAVIPLSGISNMIPKDSNSFNYSNKV